MDEANLKFRCHDCYKWLTEASLDGHAKECVVPPIGRGKIRLVHIVNERTGDFMKVNFIREAIKSQMSESTDYSETGGQEDACAPTSIADLVFFILDDDTIVASKPDGDFLKEIRTASSNRLEHNLEIVPILTGRAQKIPKMRGMSKFKTANPIYWSPSDPDFEVKIKMAINERIKSMENRVVQPPPLANAFALALVDDKSELQGDAGGVIDELDDLDFEPDEAGLDDDDDEEEEDEDIEDGNFYFL